MQLIPVPAGLLSQFLLIPLRGAGIAPEASGDT